MAGKCQSWNFPGIFSWIPGILAKIDFFSQYFKYKKFPIPKSIKCKLPSNNLISNNKKIMKIDSCTSAGY